MNGTTRDDDIETGYDFSQGERGKFYNPDMIPHIPEYLAPDDQWDENEWLHMVASNSAFDFLRDSAEDVYTTTYGTSFHDKV